MEQLTDLKAILHSKRANIYYLEKCRVMQKDGRVLYLTPANLDDVFNVRRHCPSVKTGRRKWLRRNRQPSIFYQLTGTDLG